jgi:hypothetical protein
MTELTTGSKAQVYHGTAKHTAGGLKKGDLSKFIEDAVKWRVLEQTLAEARGGFADLAPETLDALLEEAVTATRQDHAGQAG